MGEWAKGKNRDSTKIATLLTQLKFSLTQLAFLPTKDQEANIQELAVSRDTLEIGAQYAVTVGDIPMFERYLAQLQTYYHDYSIKLPESAFKYQLLGLNLLCLLAQNRVAEFHTELERLPGKEIQGNVPAESYNFFIDILMDTVRNEIASCLEKAYKDISCADAARMLSIPPGKLMEYANSRKWEVVGDRLRYRQDNQQEDGGVPSLELANMAISYAREMEQIV